MNSIQKWIAKIAGIKEEKAVPITYGSPSYEMIRGRLVTIPDNRINYIEKGYAVNDIVYSAVNLIMDKCRLPGWDLYKIADESSLKSYRSLTGRGDLSPRDYVRARDYRMKALEPIEENSRLKELLQWPNENESFQDQVAGGVGYKLLTGNQCVQGVLLAAGANTGKPYELYLLPSQHVELFVATETWPARITGYNVNLWPDLNFSREEVLHVRCWNPNFGINGEQFIGMSPIKAALKNIARNNAAKTASASKFDNGGMEAIIYVDDPRFDPEQNMEQLHAIKKTITEYKGADKTGKLAASGYKVGVAKLGLSPVELGIIESEKWDLRMICNILGGIPSQLLNDPENKTYNNQKEGEKALTTRCALPHLSSLRDSLNRKIQTDWGYKGQNVFADYDMTVFPELQQDVAETVDWMAKLGFMPPNRMLEMLQLETIEDPLFDEPWINPNERIPLSQYMSDRAVNEVDEILLNANRVNGNGKIPQNPKGEKV